MTGRDIVLKAQLSAYELTSHIEWKPAVESVRTLDPMIPNQAQRRPQRIANVHLNLIKLAGFKLSGPGLNEQDGAISVDS